MARRQLVPDRILIKADQIRDIVARLGAEVTAHQPDDELLIVGVLKGSFVFLADLVRQIDRPLEVDFITASSYNDKVTSSGVITIHQDVRIDVKGRYVVLVEDIIDSGRTIAALRAHFIAKGAKRVWVVALLTRGSQPTILTGKVLHDDTFVLGYGLDYDEKYRGLPDIWSSEWIEAPEERV